MGTVGVNEPMKPSSLPRLTGEVRGTVVWMGDGECMAESGWQDPAHTEEEPDGWWTLLRFFPQSEGEAGTPGVDAWSSSKPSCRAEVVG